jgi:O-antigen/teichoic acid export membrane protein
LAIAINFGIQVLIVRHLSKSDYGAFAYAFTIVTLCTSVCLLGLNQANTRFLPLFHERGDLKAMWGTLIFALAMSSGLGLVVALLILGARDLLSPAIVKNPAAVGVLVLFIALVPLNALDNLFQGILAVFAKPRAIFFRRHVLAPTLKLVAILVVIVAAGGARMLASGYVVAGAIGVAVYVGLIRRVLHREGLALPHTRAELRFPVREILAFSVPLLLMDAFQNLVRTMVVMVLESTRGISEVAEFRAVLPVARLSFVALQSLHILFTPAASRLFARGESHEIGHLYWQTILWIAIVSFPVLVLGSLASEEISVILFGEAYRASGGVLSILTLGCYLCAAFSLGRYGLQVLGHVRTIVLTNIASLAVGAVLALTLIPKLGAVGAAIATSAALVTQGFLAHVAFVRSGHIERLPHGRARVYASIAVAFALLAVVRLTTPVGFLLFLFLAALATLLLVRFNRESLEIERTFPEIARVPVLPRLLGLRSPR